MTVAEFSSTRELEATCAAALRKLLIACADTKLLLGYHYGEWTFGTPVLEAAIANCSLSQTELGHVRLLHGVLKAHFGDDPDRLIEGRDAAEFANVGYLDRDLADWAAVVAATLVVDVAVTRVLHAMRDSAFLPVRNVADKMLDEERYHAHHGRGWFRTLWAREEARPLLSERTETALRSVSEWFGPPDDAEDAALVAAGIKARSNADLSRDLVEDVGRTAAAVGAELSAPSAPAFNGWTPRTRRSAAAGPADEILYHVRGSKNAIFKLG